MTFNWKRLTCKPRLLPTLHAMPPPACVPLPSTHFDRPSPPANLCPRPRPSLPLCCWPTVSLHVTPRQQHAPSPCHRTCRRASPRLPVSRVALREPLRAAPHGRFHVAATRPAAPHVSPPCHLCVALGRDDCSRMRIASHRTAMHHPAFVQCDTARSGLCSVLTPRPRLASPCTCQQVN